MGGGGVCFVGFNNERAVFHHPTFSFPLLAGCWSSRLRQETPSWNGSLLCWGRSPLEGPGFVPGLMVTDRKAFSHPLLSSRWRSTTKMKYLLFYQQVARVHL